MLTHVLVLALFLAIGQCALPYPITHNRDYVWQWHQFSFPYLDNSVFLADFRDYAMLHIAGADAANAVTKKYTTYFQYGTLPNPKPNKMAAIISAMFNMVLLNLNTRPARLNNAARFYPVGSTLYNTINNSAYQLFNDQIAFLRTQVSDPNGKINSGISFGATVANTITNQRLSDGLYTDFLYRGCDPNCLDNAGGARAGYTGCCGKGKWWAPNGNGFAFSQWANMSLFGALYTDKTTPSYRVPAPPDANAPNGMSVSSMDITKVFGEQNSAQRTARQTKIGLFWVHSSNPQLIPTILREYSTYQNWGVATFTRALAMTCMAIQDAGVVHLENKFFWGLWRPWQQINWDNVHNATHITQLSDYLPFFDPCSPNTAVNWRPTVPTPPNPEYPPGHPMNSAAGVQMVRRLLGNDGDKAFTWAANGRVALNPTPIGFPPGGVAGPCLNYGSSINFNDFDFGSLYEIEHSVVAGRIYGGMHTHISELKGQQRGHDIANDMFDSGVYARIVPQDACDDCD